MYASTYSKLPGCVTDYPILADQIEHMEKKFQWLVKEVYSRLKLSGISVDDFYADVMNMKLSLKNVAAKYVEECFEKANTIAIFWGKLNRFWDFFNYELFQHVVHIIITDVKNPLLSKLAEYESEMASFLVCTKLYEFCAVWPFSLEPKKKDIKKLKNIVIKVRRKWEDCTLRDIKNITNTFAQEFFLPREFFLVAGVGKSSVSILWYVPPSLASLIEEQVNEGKEKLMSDNGFLSIIIDGVQIYPLTLLKQASLQLKKMHTSRQPKKKSQYPPQPYKLALISSEELKSYEQNEYTKRSLRGDKDDIRYKKSPTTLSTLGYLPDDSPARLVLVEGAPGVGKTTFSIEACIKWANKELLKDTAILLLLPLRDFNIQNISHLHELVALISPKDTSLVDDLEANKGEGTTLWLDGWDEIASTLDGRSFYEQLVSGEILPKARVIVTSRPWATDYIKNRQPSQHIEIIASVQDQINWVVELKKQSLPKPSSILDQFLNYLDETPAVKGNMHTPLATIITLLAYQWCQESSSALPTTVTQLYCAYTCLCIHGYLDNHPRYGPKLWKSNIFSDLSEPLNLFFFTLSQLGLNGLEDKLPRLVFPNLPSNLRLETLGLMQTVDPLYTSTEKSAVVSYHFNHLTLQEYLAAFSLSQMSDEEKHAIIQKHVNDGHFTEVLRFFSGVTKSSSILRDHMTRLIGSKNHKDKLTVFHWLFEGGDKASIVGIFGEMEMKIRSDYSWSALDFFVTGYCIARSNCAWDIYFVDSHMGDEKMAQFLQALKRQQGNAYITSINFRSNDLTSQSLRYIQDIPANFLRRLKSLNVCGNNLEGASVDHIAKTIPHMPQLEELNLDRNPAIQREGATSLISALCDHKALKVLNLSRTNIAEADCEQLGQLLSSSQCLEALNISENSLSSDSVCILFRGLQQNSSLKLLRMSWSSISLEAMKTLSAYLGENDKCKLETLNLWRCEISPESAIELAHGLGRMCSVKKLYLNINPLGDSGVTALGTALETNETITELYLVECSITTIGGAALASSLMVNSTIEELNISDNSLGGEAIQKFAELIQHNKTLNTLHIEGDDSLTQFDVITLLNSLEQNQTLEELQLSKTLKIEDSDARVWWN